MNSENNHQTLERAESSHSIVGGGERGSEAAAHEPRKASREGEVKGRRGRENGSPALLRGGDR